MRITTTQITIFLATVIASGALFAAISDDQPAAKKSPAAAKSSLDDELLKSLDNKLLEGSDDQPAKPTAKPADAPLAKPGDKPDEKTPQKQPKAADPLDDELRKSLGGDDLGDAGEDVGETQLTKIVGQMRTVERRLAASNLDATTRKQQKQIAVELAALLDQLQKQQAKQSQSGAKKPGGSASSKPGQPQQAPGNSAAANPASQPARDSSPELRANRSDRPDPLATRELMKKALDGLGLPEKERERMLQSPPDEFLPSYEFAIKKYFERIIEEEGQ